MIFKESTRTQRISKEQVWHAWLKIRQGGKGMGIDHVSISEIDRNPSKYLYPLWNRLSSGSYFPVAVKEVCIPKSNGKLRSLGIPTICDRVAQEVIRAELEVILEPLFLPSSFGSRPGKSAYDALTQCAANCWSRWYVVDVDIQGFFDNIDHKLLMDILRKYTTQSHILLYCERWLKAPVSRVDGSLDTSRFKGTPQGGVISPLLSNLFLHEVFDLWMQQHHSHMVYERYCDDIVIHTRSMEQSRFIFDRLSERLSSYGLTMNQEKSKITYCYRTSRFYKEDRTVPVSFDFLGFTFKPRLCKREDGERFWGFGGSISSRNVQRAIGLLKTRLRWRLSQSIQVLSDWMTPLLYGWLHYYGHFGLARLSRLFRLINYQLVKWIQRKYGLLSYRKAKQRLRNICKSYPNLFIHWKYGFTY